MPQSFKITKAATAIKGNIPTLLKANNIFSSGTFVMIQFPNLANDGQQIKVQ